MTSYNDNLHQNSKAYAFEYARSLRRMQTKAEEILWEALRNSQLCNLKFRRQHPFDNYILDFYNHKMKLAVEVDGEVHNDPEVAAYDKARTMSLNENGITVLRFKNTEVESDLKMVLKKIEDWFHENDLAEYEPWPEEIEIDNMNKNTNESVKSKAPFYFRRGDGGEGPDELAAERQFSRLDLYCERGIPRAAFYALLDT